MTAICPTRCTRSCQTLLCADLGFRPSNPAASRSQPSSVTVLETKIAIRVLPTAAAYAVASLQPPYSDKVDISLLLKPKDEEEETRSTVSDPASSRSADVTTTALASPAAESTRSSGAGSVPAKRQQGVHSAASPAKKQSKWSPEEDEKIIRLRGEAKKWEDISKQLPGRSAISCRLHYQNYLERRSEWDEDRKNKLARLYERFKHQMWAPVAEEMSIPWRAAEAMHWQLGEQEMARRAGVTPFSLSSGSNTTGSLHPRSHTRSSSAAPRLRRTSAPRVLQPQPAQLPSVAELTAGLPAYDTQFQSYQPHQNSPDYHRQLSGPGP